jgi:hypothetical protein
MADVIAPSKTVTFTVTRTPARIADQKTIQRLMRMQRPIQQGLRKLSRRRRREANMMGQRAGRLWLSRVPATKLVRPERGESFTLTLTPQIMRDVQAVEKYLDAKPAK